jgi:hypothetical protein
MRPRHLLVLALALFSALPTAAEAQPVEASIRMRASADRVGVGDAFTLEVRADVVGADIGKLELPDLDGFEVVGREVTRPIQFSFGAGRSSLRSTVVHHLRLRALRPGRYVLDPARVTVEGDRFESNPVRVEVVGTSAIGPTAPPPLSAPGPSPADPNAPALDGAVFDPELFLRTVVDKADPYVGEQVTMTIYLYTRIGGQPQLTREATTDGFWVHDLLGPNRPNGDRQVVHGIPFHVYVLRRVAAFPLRSGELTIGAPELRLEQASIFGLLQGGGQGAVQRRGVPVTLNVRPVPPPAPSGVVVGRYEMTSSVDRSTAEVGDAITLTVKVRGQGNLNDVRVELPPLPDVRVLPPETDDRITTEDDLVGGERTFRFLLLPQAPGPLTLPALSLPYFDPATETHGRTETQPITVTVTGTAVAAATPTPQGTTAPEPTATPAPRTAALGRLGPLRPRTELRRAELPVSAKPWYRWALAGPPLLWIAVLALGTLFTRLRRRSGAVSGDALKAARKRLRGAAALEKDGEARKFYAEVSGALTAAVESQIDLAPAGLTHTELRQVLDDRGMAADLSGRIIEELEGCDFARFSAAGASREEMTRCRQRVEALLDRLAAFRPQASEKPAEASS